VGCRGLRVRLSRWGRVTVCLSKATECATRRVSPGVNDGLRLMILYCRRLISYSNCTPPAGEVNRGETVCVGAWGCDVS